MSISGLHHVSLLVSDTERSLRFYCDLLGLKQNPDRPAMSFAGAWLDINAQQQIHLLELPNPEAGLQRPVHGGRDRHIALQCNDLEAIAAKLSAAGYAISYSKSGRAALFCRDPDDNAVELIALSA